MEENLTQNNTSPEASPEVLEESSQPESHIERHRHRNRSSHRPQFADNSGHILEVLQAAMPYIDSRMQGTMETLMKATDLIHTTRSIPQNSGELSAASLNVRAADVEGMLSSVREVGNPGERDIIDKMLNFIKAKKFYQTYRMLNQNKDILKAASTGSSSPYGYANNPNFMETLKSILPADQASNLDNVQTIMNAINAMNAMGMNTSGNNARASSNASAPNYNAYQPEYHSYHPDSDNSRQNTAASNHMNLKTETPVTPQRSATPEWYTQPGNNSVPNYTYNMRKRNSHESAPVVDSNYLNQYTPQIPPSQASSYPASNSWKPMNPSPVQPAAPAVAGSAPSKMEPAAMNQLYNNVTNIYNTLQAAGLTNGSNAPNQNNMLSAITALANSGLLGSNNHAPTVNSQSISENTDPPVSAAPGAAEQPNIMRQSNIPSMPIPAANSFQKNSSEKPFNPEELYHQLSDYRSESDLNHTPAQNYQETLEAASLHNL